MKANRIFIISLLGLAAFFFVIYTAEASPVTSFSGQLPQAGSSEIGENALEHQTSAPFRSGNRRINSSEPTRQQPIDRAAPDVVADLSVSILDGPDPVFLSRTLTYTVTVTNNTSAVTITNVILTDTLPASVSFISATPSQGTGCGSPNPLVCNLGSIRGGTTARVVILVTPNSTGSITNSASVRSTDPDPDPNTANNLASTTTTVNPMADLSLALRVSNATPAIGSTIAFTVTVTNAGPSNATGVNVRDLLTSGYTYVSATASQGNYSSGNGNWNNLTINAGASAWLRINVTVNPTGVYSNYAQVMASVLPDYDSTPGNNSTTEDDDDTLVTTPSASANLALAITDRPDPASVGGSLVYTLTVTNTGPSAATSLVLTDTLPAGVSYVSAIGSSWTCATITANRVRCTRASLNAATSTSVVLTLNVTSGAVSPLTNTAVVRAATPDPATGNNSDSETTAVSTSANLSVTLTDTPDPVNAGANLTYNMTISNAGPSIAVGVVVTNTLPANVTYQSFTGPNWSCTPSGSLVRCTRLADLASGANDTLAIIGRVNPAFTGGILNGSVLVRSNTPDPVAGNNSAATTTTVTTSADLSVSKVDTLDPVEPGTGMAYTISINNLGPSNAVGVRITDTLPTGVSYVTHVPNPEWTCSLAGNEVRCSRAAAIAAGSNAQISIAVVVGAGVTGTINNLVRVGATTPDPVSGNNSDTETTSVTPRADLSLTKVESSDPVTAGTDLTYTLTASNLGPSNALSLVMTDTLPTNVTYLSYGGSSGWTCTLLSSNRLRCTRASLAAGDNSVVSVATRVNPSASGTLNNTAVVRSASTDSSLTNNTASTSTTVNRSADLIISKTDSPDPVAEGQTLTYRMVVRNNGPSSAASVTLTAPHHQGCLCFCSIDTRQLLICFA
jgi:uncharacterized repeat protein (TIGR01451 family)